jgi:D-amino-acid dehydrogenase
MKIVVVGSGLIGLSTAYFLAKSQHDVVVIERQSGPALETSFANGGLLTPSLSDPWNAPGVASKMLSWLGREDSPVLLRPKALPSLAVWGLQFLSESRQVKFSRNMARNVRLAQYNLTVMDSLAADLSLKALEGGRGTLKVARDQATMDHMIALSGILKDQSVGFEVVDQHRACEIETALVPIRNKLVGALFCPDDGFGDAHLFCQRLAQSAKALGVTFQFDTRVTGFEQASHGVSAVLTDAGAVDADAVVIAAGSYSVALAAKLGVRLPVRPCKGYSLTVPIGNWQAGPKMPVIDDALHAVVTPLGDRLRVAGTAEFSGFDTEINPHRIENVKRLMAQIYPEFMAHYDEAAAEPWAGLRPVSATGVPIIGKTTVPNCFVNTGHGHLGWSMAAGSGKALADVINQAPPAIAIADYQP